jgi:hypothetical protein
MTARSNPLSHESGRVLARRNARRLSRQFAGVGVEIPAARLQEIASGAPVDTDEWVDVVFGLLAWEIERDERRAKFARARRCSTYYLIVAAMGLVILGVLVCAAAVFFSLALHGSPY